MLLMLIKYIHFILLFICAHGNTFILLSSLILQSYCVHWPTAVTTTCFNNWISRTYLTTCLCLLFNITHLSMSFGLGTMWASSCKTSETVVEGVRLFALITNHRSVLVFHRSLDMSSAFYPHAFHGQKSQATGVRFMNWFLEKHDLKGLYKRCCILYKAVGGNRNSWLMLV